MSPCARCDWRPDVEGGRPDVEQLAEHAAEAGHWLCPVCSNSLTESDPVHGCEKCLTRSREDLAAILVLYTELPTLLGHVKSPRYDQGRGGSDGVSLPGGNALVLLGPGSVGNRSRLGDDYEPDPATHPERWWLLGRVGPLTRLDWLEAERARYGKEHTADNSENDATSVAWRLMTWEEDFRYTRGDLYEHKPRSIHAVVEDAAAYLQVHARWAATSHDAFPDFAADISALLASVRSILQLTDRREVAEAECFDCGGDLLRTVGTRRDDSERDDMRGFEDEGYSDDWTCEKCGERYDAARYMLALRARLEAIPRSGWVLPEQAAKDLKLNPKTIRTWARRGIVAAACAALPGIRDPRLRVLPADVQTASEERQAS